MDDDTAGIALILCSAAGFGTLGVLGKLVYASALPIRSALALRFAFASVVFWAIPAVRRLRRPAARQERPDFRLRGRNLSVAFALGAFGYAGFTVFYFAALRHTTAGTAVVVAYTYPVFVVVLSGLFLGESVTRRVVVALPLSLAGVALVAGSGAASADPYGLLLALLAGTVYAAYITASRAVLSEVDARVLPAYVMPATALSFLCYGAALGRLQLPETAFEWLLVALLAVVGTVIPVFAFFAGLARLRASHVGVLSTFEPVVGVGLGAVVLGEPVTAAILTGGVLVLSAIYLIQTAESSPGGG